jgi:hypothetical protein
MIWRKILENRDSSKERLQAGGNLTVELQTGEMKLVCSALVRASSVYPCSVSNLFDFDSIVIPDIEQFEKMELI